MARHIADAVIVVACLYVLVTIVGPAMFGEIDYPDTDGSDNGMDPDAASESDGNPEPGR